MDCPAPAGTPNTARALPDLVIFDLVGVLIPERSRLGSALSASLLAADLPVDADELAEFEGLPTRATVSRIVARRLHLDPEVARPLVSAIVEDFHQRILDQLNAGASLTIAPGASTLLSELAAEGIHIGVDSELEAPLAAALIRKAGWSGIGLIEALVGSDEVPSPRPGPGQIQEILGRCGLPTDAKVAKVVGTQADAQAAIGAECDVTYSLTPDLVVGSQPVSDLGELAERILGRTLV